MLCHKPFSFIVIFLFLQLGCERAETIEHVYATLADAVKADAVGDDKWIPVLLPPSAREIREVHNIDTNEVWLAFRLDDSTQVSAAAARCTRISVEKLARVRKRPGKWWPEDLVRDGTKTQPGPHYEHHQCGPKSFLSIDAARNRAYYWTLSYYSVPCVGDTWCVKEGADERWARLDVGQVRLHAVP